MHPYMEQAERLVHFLGKSMGKNCEIVLQDIQKQQIVAIANSNVSKREIGAPLTDFALKVESEELWKETDCITNYEGKLADGTTLRSSTYFIKDGEKLLGMICINIDTTPYAVIYQQLASLCEGVMPKLPDKKLYAHTETFSASIQDTVEQTILETLDNNKIEPSRLKQDEKLAIVKNLNSKGIFQLKGSISVVADKLACSEATVYRYISKIDKKK